MALTIEKIKRVFKHNKLELEYPNENLSKEEVLDFYSTQYPELTNAHVSVLCPKSRK